MLNESDFTQLQCSLPLHLDFSALDLLRLHFVGRQTAAVSFAAKYPPLAFRFIPIEKAPLSAYMTLRGAV